MIKRALLSFIIFAAFVGALKFKVAGIRSGGNCPYPKSGLAKFDHPEDGWSSTPYSLVVADGVSSCVYTSKHWADLVSAKFQDFVGEKVVEGRLAYEPGDAVVEAYSGASVADQAFEFLKDLRKTYNDVLGKSSQEFYEKNSKDSLPKWVGIESNKVSATLMGVWLDPHQFEQSLESSVGPFEGGTLHMLQMGDSLTGVFDVWVGDQASGNVIYYPTYQTEDHRRGFNFPHQFRNTPDLHQEKLTENDELLYRSAYVELGSIVVVASDGHWDNVHHPVNTIILNLIAKFHALLNQDMLRVKAEIRGFLKVLGELMKEWFHTIQVEVIESGIITDGFLDQKVRDPKWKPQERSLFDFIFCRDTQDEPAEIPRRKILMDSLQERLSKSFKTRDMALTYPVVKKLLTKIAHIGFHHLAVVPWKSGRTTHFMKHSLRSVIYESLAVSREQMQRFQNDFDVNDVSEILANAAKHFAYLGNEYASPFYLDWVKEVDQNTMNQQSEYEKSAVGTRESETEEDRLRNVPRLQKSRSNPNNPKQRLYNIKTGGKPDDITVIAAIVVKDSPEISEDKADFLSALGNIQSEAKKTLRLVGEEQLDLLEYLKDREVSWPTVDRRNIPQDEDEEFPIDPARQSVYIKQDSEAEVQNEDVFESFDAEGDAEKNLSEAPTMDPLGRQSLDSLVEIETLDQTPEGIDFGRRLI